VSPVGTALVLLVAGVVAGVATTAGAIATLISYPALLAVGIPPLTANITNAVAVVGTGITSGLASGPELAGTGARLRRWLLPSVGGALVGAALLLSTPEGVFTWVVPVLVATAALVLLAQPRIAAARLKVREEGGREWLPFGLFAVGVYNGYFGAASGIMLLALLMLTAEPALVRANALKNVLLGIGDVVAAGVFLVFGPIDWPAALSLGAGFLVGGAIGPRVARRAPAGALRVAISLAGLVLAAGLFLSAAKHAVR
jgi:uncharacterized membrane protein YfcA